jgi:hypothetical protein
MEIKDTEAMKRYISIVDDIASDCSESSEDDVVSNEFVYVTDSLIYPNISGSYMGFLAN